VNFEQQNRRLVRFSKYVFAPKTVLPIRAGRKKQYNFVSINDLQEHNARHVDVVWLDPATELPEQSIETFAHKEKTSLTLPVRRFPRNYVAVLRGGWCHGRFCDWVGLGDQALVDCQHLDGRLAPRHFPYGRLNPRYLRLLITTPSRFPKPTRVPGRVVVLNRVAPHNYFHWLCDILPLLELVRRAGIHSADAYLADLNKPFQRQTLEALGVPLDKVLEPHNGLLVEADELVVPVFPSIVARRRLSGLLRDGFGIPRQTAVEQNGRRIFISRRMAKKRRLANEAQLEEFLAELRFESHCLETCSVGEQFRLLSEASVVVGTHGAGLTNVMVSPPGVQVVEIMEKGYRRLCFPELSGEFGHHHRVVFARRKGAHGKLHLAIPTFEEALHRAIQDIHATPSSRLAS